jgi:hypothetical protein
MRFIAALVPLIAGLSAPAHANECKMPPGAILPDWSCRWPDVCAYNGVMTWADNGLPVPAGVAKFMFIDRDGVGIRGIPMVACRFLRTKTD